MTKKNTRSDSHKHIKATLCAAMCSGTDRNASFRNWRG